MEFCQSGKVGTLLGMMEAHLLQLHASLKIQRHFLREGYSKAFHKRNDLYRKSQYSFKEFTRNEIQAVTDLRTEINILC